MYRGKSKRLYIVQEETKHESRYRDLLNEKGAHMCKMAHVFEKGWPDNYMPPDYWIEFKFVEFYGDNSIKLWRHFSDQQIVKMRELSLRGCHVFVVIFWEMGLKYGRRVQTIEYLSGRQYERFDHSLIIPFSDLVENMRGHVEDHWSVERDGAARTTYSRAPTKAQLDRQAHPFR